MIKSTSYRIEQDDLPRQAYRALRKMILEGDLAGGQKLVQEELALTLGISRTPLLAAFARLEREMLVELVPRRGAFVKQYGLQELAGVYDIRLRLEPLAAAEAARNSTGEQAREIVQLAARYSKLVASGRAGVRSADYEFHTALAEASGNPVLASIVSSHNIIPIANQHGLLKEPEVSAAEHRAIADAVSARDITTARKLMFAHINESRRNLLRKIEEKNT
jgi:DNA-binding GntR family transcriptional regulator